MVKTVLDLGCGPGIYAKIFIEQGANVTAVDASEDMVSITKNKLQDTVDAYRQDLSHGLPKERDGTFDVVVCPLMIHYLEDLTLLFSDISRRLEKQWYFLYFQRITRLSILIRQI